MGVTNDARMQDRTQVILVITGLGAHTLEEILPGSERLSRTSGQIIEQEGGHKPSPVSLHAPAMESDRDPRMQNLDIPAFLRRRIGHASS